MLDDFLEILWTAFGKSEQKISKNLSDLLGVGFSYGQILTPQQLLLKGGIELIISHYNSSHSTFAAIFIDDFYSQSFTHPLNEVLKPTYRHWPAIGGII